MTRPRRHDRAPRAQRARRDHEQVIQAQLCIYLIQNKIKYRITVTLPQTLHRQWMAEDVLSSLILLVSHPGLSLRDIQLERC